MRTIQQRLTLSHLAVTAVSVTVLVILIIIGYFVYLRSDLAAAWAGDEAQNYAYDLAYWVQDEGDSLTVSIAQNYVDAATYEMGAVFSDDADHAEWLIILSPGGHILATNFIDQYHPGEAANDTLPGFELDADLARIHYNTIAGGYVGQAAILTPDGALLGWVYYRFPNDSDFLLKDTARNAVLAAIGAALIAIIVSGFVGGWLARYFGRRLNALSRASAAFAGGNLDQRVTLDGEDEISQLGAQFNQMADQISQQMQDLRLLAEKNAQLAEEARALAALDERNRLARELHDAIKQQLFGLGLTLGSARKLMEKDPSQAAARLAQMTGMVQQIQEEMDGIIKQLRPSSLNDNGLTDGLGELCDQWQEQTGVPLTLSIRESCQLPLNIEHALYRIAQEALNNIARHAGASQVEVQLIYEDTIVHLHIDDDGVGFQPGTQSSGSFGLVSMKHRLDALGGDLEITSQPGEGTAISAHIPIP